MDARATLEAISEYVLAKTNAELHPGIVTKDEAEAQLSAITEKFKDALGS